MAQVRKILIFTNSEYGQANVALGVAYELSLQARTEVHISSFQPLEARIPRIQKLLRSAGCSSVLHFHSCLGRTMEEAFRQHVGSEYGALRPTGTLCHPPGWKGALASYKALGIVVFPWTGEGYFALLSSCIQIIEKVEPDVVVIDRFFYVATDACQALRKKYVILSPNSLKEVAMFQQPNLSFFWKFPAFSTDYGYPVPWYLVPVNTFLILAAGLCLIFTEPYRAALNDHKLHGVMHPSERLKSYSPDVEYICPATPSIDYPMLVPKNITLCGPITLPVKTLSESDPPLSAWLDAAPTVMINLGSHVSVDTETALAFCEGFKMLIAARVDVQVLWKLTNLALLESALIGSIGREISSGRIRVARWFEADPVSILQHPNVRCIVHHGGANSFYEAIAFGKPQIVLPVWYDTYDFANRAEYIGVGIYGNRTVAPYVSGEEFGDALLRIMIRPEAVQFANKAEEIAKECASFGGRHAAVRRILELCG